MKLANQVALISGAGRGIGRAIAVAFAKEGCDVVLLARSTDEIEAVAEALRARDRRALAVSCDVTDRKAVHHSLQKTRDVFGRLDVVVCNAGGGRERTLIGDDDADAWCHVIEQNLLGTYHVCRESLPLLREADGGTIINIGSGMGHQARAGNSSYNVAKAGMWMLTRCLSLEVWEDGICVNELIPGPVATALTEDFLHPGMPHPTIPSEQVKTPEEVAPLAVFLAAQGRRGPTGQSFSLARRPL